MSLDLTVIKTALAKQITDHVAQGRPITVRPFRTLATSFPCITMEVVDITFFVSMGPNGLGVVDLALTIHLNSSSVDSDELAMSDFLSVGSGNLSSIADAINSDPTLGGIVESCVCLQVGAPIDTATDYAAVFPLKITTRKVGAQA